MLSLGVITGLKRETACLDVFPPEQRPAVRCAGAKSERAGILAKGLADEGCNGLLSFGMAGGLKAGLLPGSIIIASSVTMPGGGVLETTRKWRSRLHSIIGSYDNVSIAPIAGSAKIINTPKSKKELGLSTTAVAVDMESHIVGAVAEKAGIPFMIIRAVADPAEYSIPDWLPGNISEQGTPKYAAILAGLAANPWDLFRLAQLSHDSRLALNALRKVSSRLGPLFGLD